MDKLTKTVNCFVGIAQFVYEFFINNLLNVIKNQKKIKFCAKKYCIL